jgi:hypothetical protein
MWSYAGCIITGQKLESRMNAKGENGEGEKVNKNQMRYTDNRKGVG